MSDYTALDPKEGPTVWAKRTGNYTVEIVEGTNPEEPRSSYVLSNNEIERLQNI